MGRIIPLLLAAVMLAACSGPEPPQLSQGTLLPSAEPVTDFQLTDHRGQPFTLANLKDNWTFTFFGYTHCPDVCPTSMTMLAQVQRKLEQRDGLDKLPQVVFVSVDPERDTTELLSQFVPYFHPGFIAASGDEQNTLNLTRQLGILYGKAEGSAADNYLVDHSAAIILLDPDGAFRAVFGIPHDADLIANDFLAIKTYYEATQ
jgi:protein SCO1/2